MNYLIVPNTGQKLVHGSIVMLSRFPRMKWIIQYGWYTYNNQKFSGWYFSSIPANTVIPVSDMDLQTITVVTTNADSGWCPVPPPPCPPTPPFPPMPPGPCPGPGPGIESELLERAMLTVDTIAQRNALGDEFLPNGKVVRVNDVDGEVKYFEWSSANLSWSEIDTGTTISSVSDFPPEMINTSEEGLADTDKAIPTSGAVKAAINQVSSLEWGSIQ